MSQNNKANKILRSPQTLIHAGFGTNEKLRRGASCTLESL